MLSHSAVTDEEGHPLENEDESGRRHCDYWSSIFQALEEGPRHHQHEDILRYVQQALDNIRWTIDQAEFDDLLAFLKKTQLLALTEFLTVSRCAGGLGSKFLFFVLTKLFLEGALSLVALPEAGPSLSLRHLILMTMEGLFDLLTHFAR